MSSHVINIINSGFTWLIVGLSIVGYVVTVKRTGQRWSFWILLATGWAILAIPYTLLPMGVSIEKSDMAAIWLSSYLMVMASLSLLFLKFVDMMKTRRKE